MTGSNGSVRHSSRGPVGLTSVCPAKHSSGPASPCRAHRFSTGPKGKCSTRKPHAPSRSAMICRQPWSSGLTDGRRMSASVRASESAAVAASEVDEAQGLPSNVRGWRYVSGRGLIAKPPCSGKRRPHWVKAEQAPSDEIYGSASPCPSESPPVILRPLPSGSHLSSCQPDQRFL